jgi:hypothetical protein
VFEKLSKDNICVCEDLAVAQELKNPSRIRRKDKLRRNNVVENAGEA